MLVSGVRGGRRVVYVSTSIDECGFLLYVIYLDIIPSLMQLSHSLYPLS